MLSGNAGVPDLGEAQTLLGFAKTYELIKKDNQSKLRLAEVDLSSEDSLASEISRWVYTDSQSVLLVICLAKSQTCMVAIHSLLLECRHQLILSSIWQSDDAGLRQSL